MNLGDADVVVCTSPDALTGADAERLARHVAGGGGLVLFPSAAGYGDAATQALKLPASRAAADSGLRFQTVDFDRDENKACAGQQAAVIRRALDPPTPPRSGMSTRAEPWRSLPFQCRAHR